MVNEDREIGRVNFSVFNLFIKFMGGWFTVLMVYIIAQSSTLLEMVSYGYLMDWGRYYKEYEHEKWHKFGILCIFSYGFCLNGPLRNLILVPISIYLTRKVHARMVYRLLHC
jgi:hypothetical protein